ncbi:Cyclin-dependent kinase C-2 [Camellia lanceoleosa]|uniref:Cyclin-dependent kinase C-2 n=1 Tax=Camellia lanceoleosa TaxID=1840588 RepID=A0ACC0I4Z8_9ERIC|nr:Cyclin-dependent kinase C-2 [Camellia lanceoleosa]
MLEDLNVDVNEIRLKIFFDRHALDLLEKMLTLDPSQGISAKDALDAEYFWTDPLPCDPRSLPKYESSHEFQTKKKRQQQRQNEEMAKRQKLQHPQQHARLIACFCLRIKKGMLDL